MKDKAFLAKKKASALIAPTGRRVAYYGGSFDPVHRGHITIASKLIELFLLDEFVFIPAFRAPHKIDKHPAAAIHRFAMLCLATKDLADVKVSAMELQMPEKPYTFETLGRLNVDFPDSEIFFVMGADSWNDIRAWLEWEKVLLMSNHIVVTRPGFEIEFSHITDEIREKIVDLRSGVSISGFPISDGRQSVSSNLKTKLEGDRIYITDAVWLNISAREIRTKVKMATPDWRKDVPDEVAKYIEKYQIYK